MKSTKTKKKLLKTEQEDTNSETDAKITVPADIFNKFCNTANFLRAELFRTRINTDSDTDIDTNESTTEDVTDKTSETKLTIEENVSCETSSETIKPNIWQNKPINYKVHKIRGLENETIKINKTEMDLSDLSREIVRSESLEPNIHQNKPINYEVHKIENNIRGLENETFKINTEIVVSDKNQIDINKINSVQNKTNLIPLQGLNLKDDNCEIKKVNKCKKLIRTNRKKSQINKIKVDNSVLTLKINKLVENNDIKCEIPEFKAIKPYLTSKIRHEFSNFDKNLPKNENSAVIIQPSNKFEDVTVETPEFTLLTENSRETKLEIKNENDVEEIIQSETARKTLANNLSKILSKKSEKSEKLPSSSNSAKIVSHISDFDVSKVDNLLKKNNISCKTENKRVSKNFSKINSIDFENTSVSKDDSTEFLNKNRSEESKINISKQIIDRIKPPFSKKGKIGNVVTQNMTKTEKSTENFDLKTKKIELKMQKERNKQDTLIKSKKKCIKSGNPQKNYKKRTQNFDSKMENEQLEKQMEWNEPITLNKMEKPGKPPKNFKKTEKLTLKMENGQSEEPKRRTEQIKPSTKKEKHIQTKKTENLDSKNNDEQKESNEKLLLTSKIETETIKTTLNTSKKENYTKSKSVISKEQSIDCLKMESNLNIEKFDTQIEKQCKTQNKSKVMLLKNEKISTLLKTEKQLETQVISKDMLLETECNLKTEKLNKNIGTLLPKMERYVQIENSEKLFQNDINKVKTLDKIVVLSKKTGKPVTIMTKSPLFLSKDKIQTSDQLSCSSLPDNIKSFKIDKKLNISNISKSDLIPDFNQKNEILSIPKPILMDQGIQTQSFTRDSSVQTEPLFDLPMPSLDEPLPSYLSDLVEYILDTPKYSSDMDPVKKNDLLDMSKNICAKEQNKHENFAAKQKLIQQKELRMQFFLDIRDCMNCDNNGNMMIHNAVLDNNIKLMLRQIYVLRLRNATVDIQNSHGITPVQMAVMNNSNVNIVHNLLDSGASITILDREGNSLLHLCVLYSNANVMQLILRYAQNFDIIDKRNDEGLTPLMLSAIEKKEKLVDVLLKYGADPNLRDEKSGRTALFHAVENDSDFIINLLLKYKADPKLNNYLGICPIDAARDLQNTAKDLLPISDDLEDEPIIQRKRKSKDNNGENKKLKMTFVTSLKKVDPYMQPNLLSNDVPFFSSQRQAHKYIIAKKNQQRDSS